MTEQIVDKHWDYSRQAPYYEYRPNYSGRAIDTLVHYVGGLNADEFDVADIGAGTGNLSIMLLERGMRVTAVEPNDEMRNIGIKRTAGAKIHWIRANGTATTLSDSAYDWVTFGSSFNVLDRSEALAEAYRKLKPHGYLTCMWNHRNLEDPIQHQAEDIIVKHVPNYNRGVRREDQRPILEAHKHLFKDIFYLEADFSVSRTIDQFIMAWQSVRNKYWDLETEQGRELFSTIMAEIRAKLPATFTIDYTTRAWTIQRSI